jgi:dihydroorotate dehydrogenase (fumarate)
MPIIGTGGVTNGVDAFEHILCGASAVQIGTVLVEEGVRAFTRLEQELVACLEKKGYKSLSECRGKLKERT